jgi:hypothetical protein
MELVWEACAAVPVALDAGKDGVDCLADIPATCGEVEDGVDPAGLGEQTGICP